MWAATYLMKMAGSGGLARFGRLMRSKAEIPEAAVNAAFARQMHKRLTPRSPLSVRSELGSFETGVPPVGTQWLNDVMRMSSSLGKEDLSPLHLSSIVRRAGPDYAKRVAGGLRNPTQFGEEMMQADNARRRRADRYL